MAENSTEMIEICLNFEGDDYTTVVDLETANILLNDPAEADSYMRRELHLDQNTDSDPVSQLLEEESNSITENNVVWSSKKPTKRDIEATEFFLNLRNKYSEQFNDRKTQKCEIWQKIVQEMNAKGYHVGSGRESVEKVRLKFANLQKQYLNYMKHTKTTGEKKKDPPIFYDLLHDILGCKDKVNPTRLEDSESELNNNNIDNETPGPSEIKSRFQSQPAQLKPESFNSKLFNLMKKQHEADQKERREQFEKLDNFLEKQYRQKEEFLDTFKRLVDLKARKRRRHSSTSSEEN